MSTLWSDAGSWKNLGVLVVKGGQNLPPIVEIGLLLICPPPLGSGITD